MNYITNDGEKIKTATAKDLLEYLHKSSRTPESSFAHFLEELVTRVEQQTGLVIGSDKPEDIVEALVKAGLITREEQSHPGDDDHLPRCDCGHLFEICSKPNCPLGDD